MFPAYPKKAHASGQARIRFRGRDYYLGKFGSEEYARLVGDLANKPDAAPSPRARWRCQRRRKVRVAG
jgi:hypothetical protein